MKEKLTPHLRSLLQHESVRLQYEKHPDEPELFNDPLEEEKHERVKGLVHKYPNRALIKVSYLCAAHCRFCTRIRQIGTKEGNLTEEDILRIAEYLRSHPEIDDVILSGGDPFYTPQIALRLLELIREIESVKIIRLGTRMPLQSPASFKTVPIRKLLDMLDDISQQKPVYVLLHVEHPDELNEEVLELIRQFRRRRFSMLSQTVFLKDINDDFEVLYKLFRTLYHHGVMPYYLYHCDRVDGLERFVGDIEKEKEIAERLRENLSGIACPLFVEDIAFGYGKKPVR